MVHYVTRPKPLKILWKLIISVLPWADNSSDLNSIENIWSRFKRRVYAVPNLTINTYFKRFAIIISMLKRNAAVIKEVVSRNIIILCLFL